MKNPTLSILAAMVLLSACGGKDESPVAKQQLLEAKKMELAKLEEEIAALRSELEMNGNGTLETPEGILVGLKVLEEETFEHFFEVNGTVEALEIANVSAEQGGNITRIHVTEGQEVKKGQLLVSLNTSVVNASMEELDNALVLARTTFERQSRLWDQNIGSEMQYLQAKNQVESLEKKKKTLSAQLAMSTISAPFSGVIEKLHQKEGELAAPGMPILTMVNLSQLRVKADVSENYALAVRKGQMAEVRLPSFGIDMKAPITLVGSIINPANRSFNVEVRLNNSEGTLKPNAVAVLRIKDFKAEGALVVPSICVGKDAKGSFVFVVREQDGKQKAVKTYVTTDRSSGGNTLITEGLAAGDSVIVQGYNEVANGDVIRVNKPV